MQQRLPNTGGAWSSGSLQSACVFGRCPCEMKGVWSGTKESANKGLGRPCENDRGLPMTSSKTSSPSCPTRSCKLALTCSGLLNQQLSKSNLPHSISLWSAKLNVCLFVFLFRSKCPRQPTFGWACLLFWGA